MRFHRPGAHLSRKQRQRVGTISDRIQTRASAASPNNVQAARGAANPGNWACKLDASYSLELSNHLWWQFIAIDHSPRAHLLLITWFGDRLSAVQGSGSFNGSVMDRCLDTLEQMVEGLQPLW